VSKVEPRLLKPPSNSVRRCASTSSAGSRRPRTVVEMERRAEERRRVRDSRREWHQARDEQRRAEAEACKAALRNAELEERRQQVRERQQQRRSEQRREALRTVEKAQQRVRERQALEFWILHRLVDVWCALRQAVINAEERWLLALTHYRTLLLRECYAIWKHQFGWCKAAGQACFRAKMRIATFFWRRHAFHNILRLLKALGTYGQVEAAEKRQVVMHCRVRQCVSAWRSAARAAAFDRDCIALHQYVKWLRRHVLQCWVLGTEQTKADRAFEEHREFLQQKVLGWLQEMEEEQPVASAVTLRSTNG